MIQHALFGLYFCLSLFHCHPLSSAVFHLGPLSSCWNTLSPPPDPTRLHIPFLPFYTVSRVVFLKPRAALQWLCGSAQVQDDTWDPLWSIFYLHSCLQFTKLKSSYICMVCFIYNADFQALTSVILIHYAWGRPRSAYPMLPIHFWCSTGKTLLHSLPLTAGFSPHILLLGHMVPSAVTLHVSKFTCAVPAAWNAFFRINYFSIPSSRFSSSDLLKWSDSFLWTTIVPSAYVYHNAEMICMLGILVWESNIMFLIPALPT